jgi:pimeloyl-ACP methyl ester carboxylesterase
MLNVRNAHGASVRRGLALLLVATLGLASVLGPEASASGRSGPKPTVVLVHGAFADASGWTGVARRLEQDGYTVIAPANPLRGILEDRAYLKSVLDRITGPIILVGHSYGGAVITNAATGDPDVKALVYVAAFAPDEGETFNDILGAHPGSQIGPETLDIYPYPAPDGSTHYEGSIKPEAMQRVFAADLSADEVNVLAITRRPLDASVFTVPSGVPAWKTIPSWFLVAKADLTVGADAERFMARRAGSHTVEINSSHVAMISHPRAVYDLVRAAARATT